MVSQFRLQLDRGFVEGACDEPDATLQDLKRSRQAMARERRKHVPFTPFFSAPCREMWVSLTPAQR
jgi:hypothetical protein